MAQELVLNPNDIWPSGLFSDLTLVCNGVSFPVHRIVLHAKSPVFRKLLDGKFKESTTFATCIDLPDDHPMYLGTLLDWVYKSVYDTDACSEDSYATFAVQIYAIADKDDIESLREEAAEQLVHHLDDIYIDDLVVVLRTIEECTNPKDSTLWGIILPKVKDKINSLLEDEDFKALICEKPEINFRILKAFGGESIGGTRPYVPPPESPSPSSPMRSIFIDFP